MPRYQISSGQGPAECELGVAKFLAYLCHMYEIVVLDVSSGSYHDTFKSVRIQTKHDLSEFVGSIQWICRSPYRPNHKRKNWFIQFEPIDTAAVSVFDRENVIFETFRSGGKGGQNVNKVESGVRAIYLPTGLSVECTEERSQYANKQKAIARLESLTRHENQQNHANVVHQNWNQHTQLVRGNSTVVFRGLKFQRDTNHG